MPAGWNRYQLYVDLDQELAAVSINGGAFVTKGLRSQIYANSEVFESARIGITYQGGHGDGIQELFDNVGVVQF